MSKKQPPMIFLTASPTQFVGDTKAGLVWIGFSSPFAIWDAVSKQAEEVEQPVRVGLTRGGSLQLLADLQRLEALLSQAGKDLPSPPRAQ